MEHMEYKKVLTAILAELEKHNIPYAIVDAVGTQIRNYCKLLDIEEVYEKIFGFR